MDDYAFEREGERERESMDEWMTTRLKGREREKIGKRVGLYC